MLPKEVVYDELKFTGNCLVSLLNITGDWLKFMTTGALFLC
jgi:hypothetical protein